MYRMTSIYIKKEYNLIEPYSDRIQVIEPVLTEKIGKAGTFKFDIPVTHENYNTIIPFQSRIVIYKDEIAIWHGRVIDLSDDFYMTKSVTCEGEMAYLNDSIIPPYEYSGDIPEYIDYILSIHNSQVDEEKKMYRGMVAVTDPNGYMTRANKNYPVAWDELESKLVESYGGYLRTRHIDGRIYLDYLHEYGKSNKQVLRIDENILDYSSKMGGDFCTRLIPLGAKGEGEDAQQLTIASVNNGKIYVDNAALIAKYGVIVRTNTWDNVTLPENLKTKGQTFVDAQEIPHSMELSAVDLSNMDIQIESLKLGCQTEAISPFHGLNAFYLMTAKTSYLSSPENDKVNFGPVDNTYTSKTVKIQKNTSNKVEQIKNEVYDFAKTITGASGGYVVLDTTSDEGVDTGAPWQLLIMDQPDKKTATNVIRMNQGGIAFSTNGYDGPYETAWNINGNFVADFIKTGTMLCDRIRGGALTLGGISNVDGVLKIQDASGNQIGIWDNSGISLDAGKSSITFNPDQYYDAVRIIGNAKYAGGTTMKQEMLLNYNEMRSNEDMDCPESQYALFDYYGVSVFTGDSEIAHYTEDVYAQYAYFEADMDVGGEKNRIVKTSDYGVVKLSAYELATPMFGDVGTGEIGEDGNCFVSLDPILLQTINTCCEYQVFLQKYGNGDVWVSERKPAFFVVSGTPGLQFGWELKAKQAGYEQNHLDEKRERVNTIDGTYAADGMAYVQAYMEELIS